MASSGAQLNGSFDNMLEETATLGELDAKQIQQNTREARGVTRAQRPPAAYRRSSTATRCSSKAGTLLTGVSNAYSMTRDYNEAAP